MDSVGYFISPNKLWALICTEGERCSFDTMLKLFGLESEPSLARLALIVRGADTARPDLAPEATGLHAVSLGLSALAGDDNHGMIRETFKVYDGLFAYLRFAAPPSGAKRHGGPARLSKSARASRSLRSPARAAQERHNWPAKAA
jgi:hypothetical protein